MIQRAGSPPPAGRGPAMWEPVLSSGGLALSRGPWHGTPEEGAISFWRRDDPKIARRRGRGATSGGRRPAAKWPPVGQRTIETGEELLPPRQEVPGKHPLPFLEGIKVQVVTLPLGT